MTLLLDTQVVLWWLRDDRRLGRDARRTIATADDAYVSAASIWEIAIKQSRGRLVAPPALLDAILADFRPLEITFDHALAVRDLEPIHADPFDRMLVAQATVERLTLVTNDPDIARYRVPVLPA